MKKVLVFMLMLLMVPALCWGMDSMNDQEMEKVTGQAGVKMAVDDFKMYQKIETIWYKDTDGLTTADDSAAVGITNFTQDVKVNAIGSPDHTVGNTAVSDWALQKLGTAERKPLTIDVTSQLPALSAAEGSPVSGVRIGMPTVEIVQENMSFGIGVTTDVGTVDNQSFGTFHIDGMHTAIESGVLEIAPN